MRNGKTKYVVEVPTRVLARAKAAAKRQGVSTGDFVRQAVAGRLNQIEATRRYWRR